MLQLRRGRPIRVWASRFFWDHIDADIVVLENFNEVFTNGYARIVAVTGGVQRELACGRTYRCRFNVCNQLLRALDERIS